MCSDIFMTWNTTDSYSKIREFTKHFICSRDALNRLEHNKDNNNKNDNDNHHHHKTLSFFAKDLKRMSDEMLKCGLMCLDFVRWYLVADHLLFSHSLSW